MISKQIIVTGDVQGVGFRKFAQQMAAELGIIGWARNLFSGQVEILAAATSQQSLQNFIEKLRKGPSRSKVDNLEIFDIDSNNIRVDTFEIISDGESKSDF